MNKNRIEGRDQLGKGALDSDAQYSCGSWRGKFGVACGEALSLIPGGPTICPGGLRVLRGARKGRRESAEGVVAGATFDPRRPEPKDNKESEL
jgi:hypothetical protein